MTITIEIIRDILIIAALGAYIWRMAAWKTSTDSRLKSVESRGESATSSAWKAKIEGKIENLEDHRDSHGLEVLRVHERIDQIGKEVSAIATAVGRIEGKILP